MSGAEREGPPAQAMLFHNGMWAVVNARGDQLAELQGADSYALRVRLASFYQGPVEVQGHGLVAFPNWLDLLPIQGRWIAEEERHKRAV